MNPPIKPFSFRFHNKPAFKSRKEGLAACPRRSDKGYALVALMILVTVLLISLTATLPSIYQEGQREREKETVFRGEQYARAVYLFHRQYGRFPTSVKELLGKSNGTRFLRQAYRDPLSPTGRWRFIHANAAGVLIDSWTQNIVTPGQNKNSSQNPGQTQGNSADSGLGASSGPGAPASLAISPGLRSSLDQETPSGLGSSQEQAQPGQKKPKHPPSSCDQSQSQGLGSDSSEQQTGTLLGAFIVGVAPCSSHQSIRVFNEKDHYDEWEFLGLNYVQYGMPRTQTTPSNQPGSPSSQPSLFGPSGSQNQPSSPPQPSDSSSFSNP